MALYKNESSTIYDKEGEGPNTIIYGIRCKGAKHSLVTINTRIAAVTKRYM
jgi:hypothetical protein